MKYFTYIILCKNEQHYIGHTNNLESRFLRHTNKSGAKFTKIYKPVKLVWYQEFDKEIDAIKKEKQIKGWTRNKKEKLIKEIWK